MKILYINRAKFDYLQDLVYTGLVKLLGSWNIIEYPWHIKHHINFRPYPKNLGKAKGVFFQSILTSFNKNDYNMVIVASCHPDTLKLYFDILKTIPSNVKTVFLDGGDMPEIAGDLNRIGGNDIYNEIIKIRKFDFIFKREYLLNQKYDSNVYPLPFCFNYDHIPSISSSFKYDVAFWAVESDPIRTKVLNLIENKYDCKNNGTIKNQTMKKYKRKGKFYLQELSACKINLNFRGAGWDTLRFWEVLALGGFIISQKPQIKIENDFTHGVNIVYCKDDLSDLLELCNYYLENENERIKIGQNAKIHIEQFHTDIHRAKRILEIIA